MAIDLEGLEPGVVLGNKTQVQTANNQNALIKGGDQNWAPFEFTNLSNAIIQVQNHRNAGNKVKAIYLQSHGSAGDAFIFAGGNNKVELDAVEQGGAYVTDDRSLSTNILDYYLSEKSRISGIKGKKAKEEAMADFNENSDFKLIDQFLDLTNLVDDGGTVILGACHIADDELGKGLIEGISRLVNNRIKIVGNNDYTSEVGYKKDDKGGYMPMLFDVNLTNKDKFNKGWSITDGAGKKINTGKNLQLKMQSDGDDKMYYEFKDNK